MSYRLSHTTEGREVAQADHYSAGHRFGERDAQAWHDARYTYEHDCGCSKFEDMLRHLAGFPGPRATQRKPTVGMAVTFNCGSDRYPYTVIEVLSDKRVRVREDVTHYDRAIDRYTYEDNDHGPSRVISLRPNGRWVEVGESQRAYGYTLGVREAHMDPSF